jgi:hypothetical protein
MHLPINVKSPNNISKSHMGFNSAFKGLIAFKFDCARVLFLLKSNFAMAIMDLISRAHLVSSVLIVEIFQIL